MEFERSMMGPRNNSQTSDQKTDQAAKQTPENDIKKRRDWKQKFWQPKLLENRWNAAKIPKAVHKR
jgi:hypothetical protein